MTKLYELPRGTYFRIVDPEIRVPVTGKLLSSGILKLHTLDGMYSYCTDDQGNVYHPAVWTEVEEVQGLP